MLVIVRVDNNQCLVNRVHQVNKILSFRIVITLCWFWCRLQRLGASVKEMLTLCRQEGNSYEYGF